MQIRNQRKFVACAQDFRFTRNQKTKTLLSSGRMSTFPAVHFRSQAATLEDDSYSGWLDGNRQSCFLDVQPSWDGWKVRNSIVSAKAEAVQLTTQTLKNDCFHGHFRLESRIKHNRLSSEAGFAAFQQVWGVSGSGFLSFTTLSRSETFD